MPAVDQMPYQHGYAVSGFDASWGKIASLKQVAGSGA